MTKSYVAEVLADASGEWSRNALRFATKQEAEGYVKNLASRWTLVSHTRVVESEDEPNSRWIGGTTEPI